MLEKGCPFASRQMRPYLQDGLKNEEGSVLVGGLDDTGDARHRGKVEWIHDFKIIDRICWACAIFRSIPSLPKKIADH